MVRWALRRLIHVALTLTVFACALFAGLRLAPGGPAFVLLGPDRYTPELEARINRQLGLDRPIPEQLVRWLGTVARGELGNSYFHRRPAVEVVAERLPASLELGVLAFALSVLTGVPLGVWAAARQGGPIDRVVSRGAIALVSAPAFWLGIGLIFIFSASLGLLPSAGRAPVGRVGTLGERARHLVLPLLTLTAAHAAATCLYTRAALRRSLDADYTRTARTKGAGEGRVVWRHALPAAAVPIATVAGLNLAHFLEGSIVVETLFAWPGIGQLLVASVGRRDYPVLLVVTLVGGVAVAAATVLTDLACRCLDPRLADD